MGKINILNDAGTAKATIEFNGSADYTMNAESLGGLSSTVTSDGTNTQITGILGINSTSTDVENAKLYVNGGIRLEGNAPDISSATGLSPHIGTGSFSIYDGEPGSGTEVFRANDSYTFIPRAIQQHSVPVAPASGQAYLSTHGYGTSQGDNRTHFGYNSGGSYVNYIRGDVTYFSSPVAGITLTGGGNTASIWTEPNETGMGSYEAGSNYVYVHALNVDTWNGTLDRGWNDEPSITIRNNTDKGSQANFRIHGGPGPSGGDFSIVTVSDGGFVSSDQRRKTDIVNIESALDTVKQLQGKKFKYVNSELEPQTHMSKAGGNKFGFIAQEIEDIIPEVVKLIEGPVSIPNENGYADGYAVDYSSIVALLTEAIKEQQTIIDDLKTRIETLEGGA